MALFYLSPLAGRGRRAAPAASRVRGTLHELRTSRVPLTRIPSLRLRCARNPTSPRKRGEVKKRKPHEANLAPMREGGASSMPGCLDEVRTAPDRSAGEYWIIRFRG